MDFFSLLFLVAEHLYGLLSLSVPNFRPKFLAQIFKQGSASPARFGLVFSCDSTILMFDESTKVLKAAPSDHLHHYIIFLLLTFVKKKEKQLSFNHSLMSFVVV
jgi:hypothetical protein